MNLEEEKKYKEKSENKPEGKSGEECVKVTISRKAELVTAELIARVNDGFEGGRVSRQDLISWVLAKFADGCTDLEIRAIRSDHFDEIALLELCLKKSKLSGSLPPELKKLLLAQAGMDDSSKKLSKNKLTKNSINDGFKEDVV